MITEAGRNCGLRLHFPLRKAARGAVFILSLSRHCQNRVNNKQTAACTDSAVRALENFIDRTIVAGRQIASSWLSTPAPGCADHDRRVGIMAACLSGAILAPVILLPALLANLSLSHALATALVAAAAPIGSAGVLAATASSRLTGFLLLGAATAIVCALAVATGGFNSPLLPLVALLPLEAAALSKSRAGLAAGLAAALACVAAIAALGDFAAPATHSALGGPATFTSMLLYALVRGGLSALRPAEGEAANEIAPESDAAPPHARPRGGLDTGAVRVDADTSPVLDLMPGLITRHDAHGNVVSIAGSDRLTCLEKIGDVTGRGFINRIHVADRIAFLDAFDALRLGEGRRDLQLRFERQDSAGQFVHASISLSAQQAPDGGFVGALVQSRDISDQVAGRLQASAMAEEAETANASKTRFLAAVSHELRTPLNAILGFSDILAREYFGKFNDERQREYVGLIHQSGEHLLALVNTMLDMSKIESGRYEVFVEPFMLSEVVESCDAMLRLQASQRGVALTRRMAPGLGEVVADRRAVQQILINLVGNAIKFTEAGGVINVDAAISDGQLVLSVSDTGIGIPEEKLALIGQPFVQAQNGLARHFEGTGLGLSLVKGLVDLHGGAFAIESREGEGTVVTIRLPANGSGAGASEPLAGGEAPVAFPPELPVAARKQDVSRNEINAKTALSA
jgi:cell cycle sensor histidine kinase DivJ